MDTSDPTISFDDRGNCSHCQNFDTLILPNWIDGKDGNKALEKLGQTIKARSNNKEFDCIIGLSGGLDSSYTAHLAVKKMGLRPLLFHVDAGWNTELAVSNIKNLMAGLKIELFTDVINYDLVKEAQVAFLRSGIPDQDLVQDALFFSGLYKFAKIHGIKDVLTGSNFSTECCREPEEWGGYLGIDKSLFKDIYDKHGDKNNFKNFPIIDIFKYKILFQKILGMKIHHPLNLYNFRKKSAEKLLQDEYGWKPFKHKHHESRFTRFYEDFWLPRRFGYDKRRAHFSSLIMTHQMERSAAIERLKVPEMSERFLKNEFSFISSKLSLTDSQLEQFFELPKKTFDDYKNKRNLIRAGAKIMRFFGLERRNI